MQFSDPSTKNGLIEDITFLLGVGLNAFSLEDRTRGINENYRRVLSVIWASYGGWKFMDDNVSDVSTGVPYANQTITSGTALYALPTGTLAVDGASFLTSASGTYQKLTPLTHEEFIRIGGDGYFSSTGTPQYYMLQGDVLRLLPTPNFTLSSALRVYFDQGISAFAVTDYTKTPGFNVNFHRILSVGTALDYAMLRGLQEKGQYLQVLYNWYESEIRKFYSERFREMSPPKIPPQADLVTDYE